MPTQIQTAFSKGEISPTLFGRVDAEMYRAALATARNVICHNYGGVSNRPGLRYLGPVKNHTYAPRFIPFKFKSSDTYLLEFGDLYMRVIRENGHVTEPNKTITGITAATPPVVTSAGHGYANGDEVYIASVAGMTQVNGRRFLAAGVTANTFQLNDQVTNTAIVGAGYTAYSSGGTAARVYTITTPYAIADVAKIKFFQEADVMTLTHQDYAPRELVRTGHAAWTLSVINFGTTVDHPTGLTDPGVATNAFKYKVTAVDKDTEEESLPGTSTSTFTITNITNANPGVVTSAAHELVSGDEIKINTGSMMTELWGRRFDIEKIDANSFKLRGEDTTGYAGFKPVELNVAPQTDGPNWLFFKPDGLTLYVAGSSVIYQYTLSVAWNVATAVYASKTFDVFVAGQGGTTSFHPVFISPDGTKLYAVRSQVGGETHSVYQYTLSTAWDISTASYATKRISTTTQDSTMEDVWFSAAGTAMFAWGNVNDTIYQYTLGTPWDVSTATYASKSFSTAAQTINLDQFYFRDDGLAFFLQNSSTFFQYAMSTAWDISTASYTSKSASLSTFGTLGGFHMSASGDKFFVTDTTTDLVRAFPVPTAWDVSSVTWTKDATFWKCFTSSATASSTLSFTNVANADKYYAYHSSTATGSYGFMKSSSSSPIEGLSSLTPDNTKGPPFERSPFAGTQNYPTAVGGYEQRRVFGGSFDQPDTSFFSKIGVPKNFSSSFPTQADDPIQATLVSGSPEEIRHYVGGNDLLVFTEGAEWKINSGPDSGFSPDTVKQKIQSNWGSSHIRPLVLGNTTMFVPQSQIKCRTIEYSFQTNGYITSDLNTLAGHIFHEYILTDWSAVKDPDPLIVTIRADGDAPVLTLDVTAEVVAWARWDTRGSFESVGVTRAFADDHEETIYFVVKRTINGQTVRAVEYVAAREIFDVRDSFFVDCGVTYDAPITITGTTAANPVVVAAPSHGLANGDYVDISDITWTPTYDAYDTETQPAQLNLTRFKAKNVTADTFELTDESDVNINGSAYTAYVSGGKARKCVTTISGLWHLVGSAVTVLADGIPVTGHTVSSTGTITLATRASRVHVGLGYTSDIETLNIETQQGTSQGKPKKISTATVRFNRSRGVYYGRDFTKMHQLTQTDFGVLGATTGLFTGDIPVDFPPEWESNGRMAFRQRLPLPMSIGAIVPDFEVGR